MKFVKARSGKKLTTYISMFIAILFSVSIANAIDFGKANDAINAIKTNTTSIDLPIAQQEINKGVQFLNPKIHVTPITAHWTNTMLIKFTEGTNIDTVMSTLAETGLTSEKYADNGDGFFVRINIEDTKAPQKALLLAKYAVIESVQVNNTVYETLKESFDKKGKSINNSDTLEAVFEITEHGVLSSDV